jgi:Methyltransferase domain
VLTAARIASKARHCTVLGLGPVYPLKDNRDYPVETRPGSILDDHLESHYDVETIIDDEWRSYSRQKTAAIIADYLPLSRAPSRRLLNAGAIVHGLNIPSWDEVCVDLFVAPLRKNRSGICADIENLPFAVGEFGAVVCVGEVLGYCDPARAIAELARVLAPSGVLICDFANSRSFRYWLTRAYRRAADMIKDSNNGSTECIWVYDPDYVQSVLRSSGFAVRHVLGTHSWSALSRRFGASPQAAVRLQKMLDRLPQPASHADVTTIVAVRS